MKKNITDNIRMAAPDAIIVISKDRKIIAFNDAAERITGYKFSDIINTDFKILFRNSEKDEKYILSSIKENDSHVNITLNITTDNSSTLDVLATLTPVFQPKTGLLGVVIVLRDIQEMVTLQESLLQVNRKLMNERNLLDSLFNNINEGIFTINLEKKITSFNKAAELITGYTSKEAIDREYWSILKYQKMEFRDFFISQLSEDKPIKNFELIILQKSGARLPIRLSIAKLFNDINKITGYILSFQDISELMNLTNQLKKNYHYDNMIGRSKRMQEIYHLLNSAAGSRSTVLITGESGTGKELVARALHFNSEVKTKPFITVNCSAFVETLLESELFGHEKGAFTGAISSKPGRFEMVKDGTIFIDEIGDMSRETQVKLLRVLDNREFERVGGTNTIKMKARIVTATNRNLGEEITKKRFREDLFYRINIVNISLPPLRERKEDLSLLIEHFLEKFRNQFKKNIHFISTNALLVLQKYDWPGNIRELENVIERAFVICNTDTIRMDSLPERLWQNKPDILSGLTSNINMSLHEAERMIIENILKKHNGHRGKAAKEMNMDRSTLWRKIKKYNL
ncbi:sigma 54-interacting transcriptional regulator [Candidatus Neomarinimicrobiota bacterium]